MPVFILFLGVFFICIIAAIVGYCIFFFLKKEKTARGFYVFGMVLFALLLFGIIMQFILASR